MEEGDPGVLVLLRGVVMKVGIVPNCAGVLGAGVRW